ncbi:MAG: GGDEF domain-containing protein [Patescibacteria group bacterium]
MTESDKTSEIWQKAVEQKAKNKTRIGQLLAQAKKGRIVPISLPGDSRTALRLLMRERRTERYRTMANVDSLTGLSNKRFLYDLLPLELARVQRGKSLAVVSGDLQELKRYNDTFGHDGGDRAIQAVSEGMKRTIRDTDTAAHLSGDEFAVLLPDISPQQAGKESLYATQKEMSAAVALRMNRAIHEQTVQDANLDQKQTIHMDIGVTIAQKDDTPESVLKCSDEAMYQMKRLNKTTNNQYISSIVIATREDRTTVFDRASFGEDGRSIHFDRLTSA